MLIPYLRQSRAREKTISIDEQRLSITKWAEATGVTLAPEVVEQGVSGSKPWRERELGRAVEACEDGRAGGIVVAYQDRLSRENGLATAEVWDALQRAGARLVASGEGLDTASGDQELIFTIKAGIAREQWKRHKTNWANARRNAIERGVHVGPTPAGYDRPTKGEKLVPGTHAPAVLAAFKAADAGKSNSYIARMFTNAEVPTSKSSERWSERSVAKLLKNEAYIGVARSGDFRNEEAHEAIVPRALFNRVKSRRHASVYALRNKRLQPGGAKITLADMVASAGIERSWLSNALVCGTCGAKMTFEAVHRHRPTADDAFAVSTYGTLRCKNVMGTKTLEPCTHRVSISTLKAEPLALAMLREEITAFRFGPLHADADTERRERLEEQATDTRDKLGELADDIDLPLDVLKRRSAKLTERLEEIEEQLYAMDTKNGGELLFPEIRKSFEDVWPTLSVEVKGDFVVSTLGRLVVTDGTLQVAA